MTAHHNGLTLVELAGTWTAVRPDPATGRAEPVTHAFAGRTKLEEALDAGWAYLPGCEPCSEYRAAHDPTGGPVYSVTRLKGMDLAVHVDGRPAGLVTPAPGHRWTATAPDGHSWTCGRHKAAVLALAEHALAVTPHVP